MREQELFVMLGEVEEKKIIEAGNAIKKNNRPVWIKFAAMVASLAIVIVASISVRNYFSPNGNTPEINSVSDLKQQKPEEESKKIQLVVNEVESMISTDMDVEYSALEKLPLYVWETILEEFHEFVGISYDDFTAKIPNIWKYSNFYSLSTRGYKDSNLKEEYRLHDYVFDYRTENGGQATIALCSFEEPLRDYFVVCDNQEQSEINGVPLTIYGHKNIYLVQFSYQNVYYDIETNNISLEELEELLRSLLTVTYSEIEDAPADEHGNYMEAVNSEDLTNDIKEFFCGSYIDNNGNFIVVLTEDTMENRTAICKKLGIEENNVIFKIGTYTLDYLTELQSKISNAMINKELPFVVSSAVDEISNKIRVGVITEDETELKKLKALDSMGEAMEIEFYSGNTVKETLIEIKNNKE